MSTLEPHVSASLTVRSRTRNQREKKLSINFQVVGEPFEMMKKMLNQNLASKSKTNI
jgi:hypothetical protein